MYFEDQKAILLHVPKTAGNSISSKLVQYSSDRMLVRGHQDGVDRFEIVGDVTPHKHATLQDYYDVLGEQLYGHRIFITVRHPVDRAVSLYFSPHRGMRLTPKARVCSVMARALNVDVSFGEGAWLYREPDFSLTQFRKLIKRTPSICDFLTANGRFVVPELMIRQENLSRDFGQFCELLEIPNIRLGERRNVSLASSDLVQRKRKDPEVWRECINQFAGDFELLEIDHSPH